MVLPPAGPPPPSDIPEGWKAHWNAEYKAWFYENIYTEESVWVKPTAPVYPPQTGARLPPGPPPGYEAVQQPAPVEKSRDPASLPSTMAAVSLSDGNQYSQPPQQAPTYAPAAPQPPSQQQYPPPPPNAAIPQATPPSLYAATPPTARAPSPAAATNPTETSRDYPQAPQYPPQPTYPGYPPQQSPAPGYPPRQAPAPGYPPQQAPAPGYPPQQAPAPGYPPQQQYSPQPNYAQPQYGQAPPPPQPAQAQKGGFMGMLQGKVGNKIPGGANTVLGLGGGLLAGAVLEHEWDKHEDRERRHHHGGLGGLGGLMRGFGGDSGAPVVQNVTVDETVYVDDNNYNNDTFINF